MFATHKEAREAGWHSRRHRTNAEQIAARERYGTRKARRARKRAEAEARNTNPDQQ